MRQGNCKDGVREIALDLDSAPEFLDNDPTRDVQPEAGSHVPFGCEKWFKHPGEVGFRNSTAGVGHFDANLRWFVPYRDSQSTVETIFHRIRGILE